MRKIIYECDTCGTVLSDSDKIRKPHISIIIGQKSGWVSTTLNYVPGCWHFDAQTSGIFQFCNAGCLASHFAKLRKRSV